MVTSTSDSGAGSLRADIQMSNAAGGANTITFGPGLSGTITLTSGQLEISNDLTITGPGASSLTISGNNKSRVFQVDTNVNATISGLTISGGHAPDGVQGTAGYYNMQGSYIPGGPGTAGADGGGIYNLGSLALSSDVVTNNFAGAGGAGGSGPQLFLRGFAGGGPGGTGGYGGAIYSTSSLTILSCSISGNDAGAGGTGGPLQNGAAGGVGGGIYGTGPLSISGSTLSANSGGMGGAGGYAALGGEGGAAGAIYCTNSLQLSNSSIISNLGGAGGAPGVDSSGANALGGSAGGIYCAGLLRAIATTISYNIAPTTTSSFPIFPPSSQGGGILVSSAAILVNCTIANNTADEGGGIYSSSSLTMTNDTVSGNVALVGLGLFVGSGLPLLSNTIFGGNLENFYADSRFMHGDVHGNLDPRGAFNLIQDGTGMAGLNASNNNQIGTTATPIRPFLSALDDYGGPTQTMPPLPGSPALDAGNNALALDPNGQPLTVDQSGFPRIVDALHTGTPRVDLGAAELSPLPTSPLTVSNPADRISAHLSATDLSMREAVAIANLFGGTEIINFSSGLTITNFGTFEFSRSISQLTITGPGPGGILIGNIQIDAGVSADVEGAAGTILNFGRLTLKSDKLDGEASNSAGAIFNSGALNATDCTFTNSTGDMGGGLYNISTGVVSLTRCTFTNNTGRLTGGAIVNVGSLYMTDCTITGNKVLNYQTGAGAGAGISNSGSLTLVDSTVGGNTGELEGGGIDNRAGTLIVRNSTINGNQTSGGAGGGIYNAGSVTVTDSTVSGNTAAGGGGIDSTGSMTLLEATISGNTATANGGAGIHNSGTLTIANCTISGNESKQGDGGGIDNGGTLTLTNCTVSDNTSFVGNGGGLALTGGVASIYNTIVALNHNLARPDISGNLDYNYVTKQAQYTRGVPSSSNLVSDGSGNLPFDMSGNTANGNLLGTSITLLDPRLSPLGNYGGPTQTMALRTGSPAIDAGSNALAVGPDGKPLLTDQRGDYRVFNGTVDIGAVEAGSSPLLPGDADGDGKVGFSDLVILARHYGMTNATWADGDFNNDGSVGFDDFVILARNYGQSVANVALATRSQTLAASGASPANVAFDLLPADATGHRHVASRGRLRVR